MSFRLMDLKKSVRKGRDDYRVSPALLDGRPHAFQIAFILQQFEQHLGCPRRTLDPSMLLDFVGDRRLGRGLLAALSQWYRVRPRTFPEILKSYGEPGQEKLRLYSKGIFGPVELRSWLFMAINQRGGGYLDPDGEQFFWRQQEQTLGVRFEDLLTLTTSDSPEEAILVRTGPQPTAADVMSAYNVRALTTLLRSADEVEIRFMAEPRMVERAAQIWAGHFGVEWTAESHMLRLFGRADTLGSWTRHGRHIERVSLELLAGHELGAQELRGKLLIAGKPCSFQWKPDQLALLGSGFGSALDDSSPSQVERLLSHLRRERERLDGSAISIRHPGCVVGVKDGVFLPHIELRRGDITLYLRISSSGEENITAFRGKTPVVIIGGWTKPGDAFVLHFPGELPQQVCERDLLSFLAARIDDLQNTWAPVKSAPMQELRPAA